MEVRSDSAETYIAQRHTHSPRHTHSFTHVQQHLLDIRGTEAQKLSVGSSGLSLSVCLLRVESGIVADIEVDSLLPSDCDTFYQIKSQPISIR